MRGLMISITLLHMAGPLAAQEASDSARQAEVRSVVQQFHAALAATDSTTALDQLHPAVVVYESGHAETLSQYQSGHLTSDMAFAAAMQREIANESVTLWGDVALYNAETHSSGTWRDREIDAHGAETIVLVRTSDGWRIRHIHWSSR